jgi:hypothetical protein
VLKIVCVVCKRHFECIYYCFTSSHHITSHTHTHTHRCDVGDVHVRFANSDYNALMKSIAGVTAKGELSEEEKARLAAQEEQKKVEASRKKRAKLQTRRRSSQVSARGTRGTMKSKKSRALSVRSHDASLAPPSGMCVIVYAYTGFTFMVGDVYLILYVYPLTHTRLYYFLHSTA